MAKTEAELIEESVSFLVSRGAVETKVLGHGYDRERHQHFARVVGVNTNGRECHSLVTKPYRRAA